jgi:hypothetical protein
MKRHAEMIEALVCDLFACAVAHRLFYIVSGPIGEQRIEPHDGLVGGLQFEVWLTVDGPAKKP